jgi:hypothetical protein
MMMMEVFNQCEAVDIVQDDEEEAPIEDLQDEVTLA